MKDFHLLIYSIAYTIVLSYVIDELGKESDRIIKTCELLNAFSINCEPKKDGIRLYGKELPKKPEVEIKTHMDHRLAMTAVILATYCGAEIDNTEIIKVTHPEFMDFISSLK